MKVQTKKVVWFGVILLGIFLFSPSAQAQASRDASSFGIGLGMSTVATGISMKKMLSGSTAVQGVVGASGGWGYRSKFGYSTAKLGVGADFLLEQPSLAAGEVLALGWNYGIGGGIGVGSGDLDLGVTGVLGLEFNFVPAPFDLVLEYRPGIYFEAGHDEGGISIAFIQFTGHIRFWF